MNSENDNEKRGSASFVELKDIINSEKIKNPQTLNRLQDYFKDPNDNEKKEEK